MHGGLPGAPAQARAHGADGVIRHGEKDDLRVLDDALRIAARAARHAGDRIAAARKREREAWAYSARADEAQPLSRDTRNPDGRARARAPAIRAVHSRCPR